MTTLAATLQSYFTTYLVGQRAASAHTITAYRDTWRMLLTWVHHSTGTRPCDVDLDDLDAEAITGFLDYLRTQRGNGPRTRNARLAAIHSVFSYAAYRHPRTRRVHRQSARDPHHQHPHRDPDLADRSRGHCLAGRPRPLHSGRTP